MEVIEEKVSIKIETKRPAMNTRICLVGDVCKDAKTLEAAESFGLPIVISETGLDFVRESNWRTLYVLDEFEGSTYDFLRKTRQCILGPPALKYAAERGLGLGHNTRPIYNYAMSDVVTCFTGIRKKDELTRLVNLIHSMGGCIKKDLNTKTTHLICNQSSGDKYQYAKTFRLSVVRPEWVYAAWKQRDDFNFRATLETFSKDYKLRAFEGQKICFFGFPEEECKHMIEVLIENGGVPVELSDPECSHVIMPNAGAYLTSTETAISNITNTNTNPLHINQNITITNNQARAKSNNLTQNIQNDVLVIAENQELNVSVPNELNKSTAALLSAKKNKENSDVAIEQQQQIDSSSKQMEPIDNSMLVCFDERLVVDADVNNVVDDNCVLPDSDEEEIRDAIAPKSEPLNDKSSASTPLAIRKRRPITCLQLKPEQLDGIILNEETANLFPQVGNISPILASNRTDAADGDVDAQMQQSELKRKRDESFDNVSQISTDSYIQPASTKKPKLLRTGSISRTLKRSMSFVADRTPIIRGIRSRRSSIAAANTSSFFESNDVNDSNASLASLNATLNDSIRKPVKDKFRNFCERITRSNSKKNRESSILEEDEDQQHPLPADQTLDGFKTPKAPKGVSRYSSNQAATTSSASKSKSVKRLFCSTTPTVAAASPAANAFVAATKEKEELSINKKNVAQEVTDFGLAVPVVGKMVVDEHMANAKPDPQNQHTHILKSDWFWYTIQNGFANEMDYLFGDYLESIANTPNTDRHESIPLSFSKRKRKRFSQRLQFEGTPVSTGKRRSSVSDAGMLSGSFFDCTGSPDVRGSQELLLSESEAGSIDLPPGKRSMRFNHFMDFYTTESNYVGILDTILNLFKNKLEELADTNDALLNKSEIKSIFGNFSPIHDVHRRMLEHLRSLQSNWKEDCLIGDIIIEYRNELIKAYPPYVNFYEQMRDHLARCDKEYPRFHAFLKINQTKPECGRQSLQDLMIRPVQRLPSISLLLNDILKYTEATNPDHARLSEALKIIKDVTMHINEDKRRTEAHKAFFAIFHDIEGIPQDFLSSNRTLISKCEVSELSECLSGRGDCLILYLFTDSIEVCKKSAGKKHKHVELIPLKNIRFVIDITDSPRAFALLQRGKKDKLCTLSISDEETDKLSYLKKLCVQMAEHACRTDTDKILLYRTSQELEVDISDVNISTLSRAFRLAAKTRLKVGRAFSFNKTPNKLKRAVSTMMTSPFGSSNSLTPASQLAQMRLASCSNINEMDSIKLRGSSPSVQSDVAMQSIPEQPPHKNTTPIGRI